MKHAIRNHGLARQAGGILLHLAHVVLLAVGMMGMVALTTDRSWPGAPGDAQAGFETVPYGLSAEMARVRDWVANRYQVSGESLEPVLAAAEEAGRDRGVDPLLIVAIVAVESSFNPRAVSNAGAQGLMQVIPRYHRDKIGRKSGKNALFDPAFNVHVGTQVLHEGLTRYGSLQNALQYYNGSLGDPSLRYTRKVMALKKRLVAAAAGRATSAG